jgi:hypothetical protein
MRLHQRKMETQAGIRFLEAPVGIEPTNKGFADPPLSHLGTAPRLPKIIPQIASKCFKGAIKRRVAVKGEQSLPPPRKEGELVPT